MSLFSKAKEVEITLFSPLEGNITYGGKPAAGAKIKLWIKWKDQDGETQVFTADDNGQFKIPGIKSTYKDNPLAQLVITQEITVEYEGNSTLIWTLSRTSSDEFGELGGVPSSFTCELSDELAVYKIDETSLATNCQWELAK